MHQIDTVCTRCDEHIDLFRRTHLTPEIDGTRRGDDELVWCEQRRADSLEVHLFGDAVEHDVMIGTDLHRVRPLGGRARQPGQPDPEPTVDLDEFSEAALHQRSVTSRPPVRCSDRVRAARFSPGFHTHKTIF